MSVWYLTKGNAWSLLRNKQSQGHERLPGFSATAITCAQQNATDAFKARASNSQSENKAFPPAFFPKLANHRPSYKAARKEISLPDSSQ